MLGPGFQSFVAWRYLLARPMRLSRPIVALIVAVVAGSVAVSTVAKGLEWWWTGHGNGKPYNELVAAMSNIHAYDERGMWMTIGAGALLLVVGILLAIVRGPWKRAIGWGLIIAGLRTVAFGGLVPLMVADQTFTEVGAWWGLVSLAPLVLLIPLLVFRYLFTFFTTVSMAGVFVGSMALVVVLSVMSGFESDLRYKILGSNAHVRVTREEGMMSDWRDVMVRVKKIPGVVAVTPYATTEVVLSANQNYATVVIKGIDPATVGDVTDLVKDIEGEPDEDAAAMQRLQPLEKDPLDNEVDVGPDAGVPVPGKPVVDPAPPDLPTGGGPIDYSSDDVDAGVGKGSAKGKKPAAAPDEPIDFSGDDDDSSGSGTGTGTGTGTGSAKTDPVPDDFEGKGTDVGPPQDFSGTDNSLGTLIQGFDKDHPDDDDFDQPDAEAGRLALLDGVLVGKELVKQLHLFTGQEVRLVSPLADPANPDATGTPIPFHRDYRIAGTFYTGMYEYDLKFVYVPLESLQDFIQIGDDVDGIEVRVTDPDDTEEVKSRIEAELGPEYKVEDWKEMNRNLFSALKLEKIAMFLVLAIIILVASFSIVGNLIMVVVEKGKEIALLKTLGASDIGVMRVFIMQGFFIGLVGTMVGVAEGLLICVLCKAFGFPINPDVYYIKTLPIHVEMSSVLVIAAAGLVISAVATLYPALIAARLRPAVGLRHD